MLITTEIKSIITHTHEQGLFAGIKRIGICYSGTDMPARNRNVTVLFSLIASMTVGALVLMALDNHQPIAGAYSLSSYLRLSPAEDAVKNTLTQTTGYWDRVEVYYSQTAGGKADELALLTRLENGNKSEFHFVIGNGNGAGDGVIEAGQYWQLQRLCHGRNGVVRICVISDGRTGSVTDHQIKRTNALVECLLRTFDISPRSIQYPANWEM
jgi:hypothetical protein